jgi:hypothetical protein
VWVRSVSFESDRVVVDVALRRRRLCCPKCSYSTRHRENLNAISRSVGQGCLKPVDYPINTAKILSTA